MLHHADDIVRTCADYQGLKKKDSEVFKKN